MLERIIALMADGQFHSGEELGDKLGISRAAVWKHLKKLDDLDIPYSSVKGRGYRLQDDVEVLNADRIKQTLQQRLDCLEILLDVDSTNTYVFQRAREYMGQRYAVLAEKQRQGRGRRGRHWVSPFGKNIYLSLLESFQGGITQLEGLSLVAGIAVQRALSKLGVDGVQLKWPNDVYLNDKKLAGILMEVTGEYSSHCQVVIGIGLNVNLNVDEAESIDQPWTSLKQVVANISRNDVASQLLNELMLALDQFKQEGFSSFQQTWSELDIYHGREVDILSQSENEQPRFSGVVKGVNRKGELMLMTSRGIQVINAGEISVRAVR